MFYKRHLRSHKKVQILREIASQFIACFHFLQKKTLQGDSELFDGCKCLLSYPRHDNDRYYD